MKETGARKYSRAVVDAFFEVMTIVDAAHDTQDLRNLKSLNFEKLVGDRKGQHSIRLNDQWRLIVEVRTEGREQFLRIIEITDYH